MLTKKQNLLAAIQKNNPDWVPNGLEPVAWVGPPFVERHFQEGNDCFLCHWSFEEGMEGGSYPTPGAHPIKDINKWKEQITIPNIDSVDWTPIRDYAATIDHSEHIVCGYSEMGLFERSYLLLGMEEALMAYLTDPEPMKEMIHAIADYKIAVISRMHEIANLDMVWYGDDWGTQHNLFMPAKTWREILKPETMRIYQCMKERGILVNQHSCGKIELIFDDFVEMGVDIWNPCQPCNDLAALKKKYGTRITFAGGIDSQFVLDRPGATPDEVRIEVRKRIDEMATGGGYIAMPSHAVPLRPDIVAALNDEIDTYGRAVYAR